MNMYKVIPNLQKKRNGTLETLEIPQMRKIMNMQFHLRMQG